MVHFEIEELMRLQTRQHNIRNLSVIAHVDHGKSTLTDSLLAGAGMMRMEDAGNRCATDTLEYEKERGITVKSTAVSMMFDLASVPRAALPAEFEGNQCLVNLIDCPGHLDFSSEVTAALRLTDGALVVVDCVDGVCVQTETVLRQALMEGIQPVLVINKMDRAFFQMKFTPEELFLRIRQIIESVNAIISTYSAQVESESEDPSGSSAASLGVRGNLSPDEGTVCFSAGLLGWGFTLPQVARKWYPTVRDQPRLIRRLWGDNWVDPKTNKWSTQEGPGLVRGFCQFVVKPLGQVLTAAQNGDLAALHPLLQRLGSQVSMRELEEAYGGSNTKDLIKRAMQSIIPAHEALVEMAACKLPSPVKAQLHRGPMLYTGPIDDETGQAVRNCDVNGPLTIFIAKLVPDPGVKGRFLALGRIFSGSVKSGDKVRILGPNFDPEQQQSAGSSSAAKDEYKGVINRTCVMAAAQPWNVETVGAGNIVALGGVDKFILKTATLVSRDDSFPLKNMKFSVSPIVRQAVSTKDAKHLPQLVTALKKLTKVDPLVQISSSEHGGHVIAGAGELHLELIFLDLQGLLGDGIEIVKSQPVVSYCETVLGESDRVCMAKSANRHNRLYMKAEPLGLEFCSAVQAGTLQTQGGDRDALGKELVAKYGWDQNDTKKIWCWGPESASVSAAGGGGSSSSSGSSAGGPSNVLVDCTRAVAYMNETRDSLSAAFKWVAGEGVLCGEPLQGVRFNVMDAVLHADVVHRGGGQLIPAARRVLFASQLTAQPRLMEPIYQVDIQGPRSVLGSAYNVLNNRRGQIVDILEAQGGSSVGSNNVVTIRAHMPVAESFGFVADLGGATGGQAFPSLAFSHWAVMPEDPLQPGTLPNKIVKEIRERKRMNAGLPSLDDYLDKL